MAQRVLVTGGTGFVGGWTIVELLRRGYAVRTTVRSAAREADVRAAVGTQIAPDGLEFALADLTADAGWDTAAADCDAVLHIASPLGNGGDDESLIAAAQGGTLRVLAAAARAGVKRVVMTSSTAACTPAKPLERAIDENDWTDPEQKDLAAYRKSKLLAEKAAWDFIAGAPQTQLTTILPGAIFGPVLTREHLGSVGIIQRLLDGQPPALPRLGFNITDVRDLAELHIKAMETPQAAGQRYIALGESLWYGEVAQALKERLGEKAAKVPTAAMPDLVAKGLAVASPQMKALLPLLGRTQKFSTDKARAELGFAPRPARDTVADCGASLVD
ncbi:MAG: epimerase [Phenylobacterium sp.]|uniref:NAD-dependent epimerase/dehydratase family protein n=1 Tax=Phenylobacterium sp. TaxID=1871053 RepID=UPI0025E0EA4E|nr:NAD-dependent epimerase/dehydratase family protein [Phenylobacterium sp.]MBA4011085.1 epimerase [Phenylobacterium sp.]